MRIANTQFALSPSKMDWPYFIQDPRFSSPTNILEHLQHHLHPLTEADLEVIYDESQYRMLNEPTNTELDLFTEFESDPDSTNRMLQFIELTTANERSRNL